LSNCALTCGTVGLASMIISSPGRKLVKSRDEIAEEEGKEIEEEEEEEEEDDVEELELDPEEGGGDSFTAARATASSFL
jgi:hypothetical protein